MERQHQHAPEPRVAGLQEPAVIESDNAEGGERVICSYMSHHDVDRDVDFEDQCYHLPRSHSVQGVPRHHRKRTLKPVARICGLGGHWAAMLSEPTLDSLRGSVIGLCYKTGLGRSVKRIRPTNKRMLKNEALAVHAMMAKIERLHHVQRGHGASMFPMTPPNSPPN